MKVLDNSEEIKKFVTLLFFDVNGALTPAQISLRVMFEKESEMIKDTITNFMGPSFIPLNQPLPLHKKLFGSKVDVDICFFVGEPLCIRVKDIFLTDAGPPLLQFVIDQGIAQTNGDPVPDSEIIGFVSTQAKNQAEPTIYKVTAVNDYRKVEKLNIKNGIHSWQLMSQKSPRIKGAINNFEEDFANNSLQTDLSKLLN